MTPVNKARLALLVTIALLSMAIDPALAEPCAPEGCWKQS